MRSRKSRSSSSIIDSFESKWWYRLPDRIPAASAISRTVVLRVALLGEQLAGDRHDLGASRRDEPDVGA